MEYKLKEILNFHNHKRVPLSKMQRNQKSFSKYPYYGAQGIIDYIDNYIFDGTYLLIAEDGENLRSRKNNIATIAKNKFWVNNHAHILSVKENFNIYYILYLINSMDISGYLTGTVQPKLSKKNLESVILNIPEKNIQDKIGDLIVNIENKINTNDKLIANLEELSQILFKRWFIDFEFPNEEGVPYKSSGGEMIDSEIGEIPKGWEISKLDKIINIKSGKRPRNKVNIMDNKNKTPIIGASKIMGYTSDYLESEPILVMGRVGTHGVIQRFNNNVWPSDNTFIIKSKFMIYSYFILINIDYKSLNRGSTQPLLSQKDIKNINIIIPKSDNLIVKYEEITNIYFKEIDVIKDQISYLIELRDTLLPKLMSGELEIPDDIEVNIDEFSI